MKDKWLGYAIMGVSIILMTLALFDLTETTFGYTSISLEHSFITLLIGYGIVVSSKTKKVNK